MNAEKIQDIEENISDNVEIDETAVEQDCAEQTKDKKSALSRLKSFFAKKSSAQVKPAEVSEHSLDKLTKKATAENIQKINLFLSTIENQLDKVDVQNQTLLSQITNLKSNNESLLKQVEALTYNNDKLTEQFNNMKKREKVAKTLAIISAILAIGLSAYNILKVILQF